MNRILHLVAGVAFGDQTGGAEYFGIQLARYMDRRRFDSRVFAMWRYGSLAEKRWLAKLEGEGVQIYGLVPISQTPILDLPKILVSLWQATSIFQPHIITSHSQRGDLLNIFIHLFHPVKPRAARSVQLDRVWLNRPYLDIFFNQIMFPFVFDLEIPSSEAIRQRLDNRLTARLLRKKSILCYSGLESHVFEQVRHVKIPHLPEQISGRRPLIGVVGRLTKQKGHTDLLRAIKIVRANRPVHLLVIGSGELDYELREQARALELQDCVHFLGSRDDVLDLLPHLDLFVSSSLWEGFPTVLLEAMAMGVPVIATDVSGSRELVLDGVTGRLVPPRNPADLAQAILAMLEDPERARAMANCARRHAAQFTIERAVACYTKIYEQCLNLAA